MSPIGSNVAVSYQGTIVAKNADNNTTQNFTTGYFSKDVALNFSTSILSDTGLNTPLLTSDGLTPVNIVRTREFNHNGDIGIAQDSNLSNLSSINIPADKFTNGSAFIDIRYNIDKNITRTINPIQITFHDADAESNAAYSIAHEEENHYIPTGHQDLNAIKNFYYAKVSPSKSEYPRVNMNISPLVMTPLSVDIFCDKNDSFCKKTKVMDNTDTSTTTREQAGWYLSNRHEGNIDGNVTRLIPSNNNVALNPNPTIVPISPLSLPNGHTRENATFTNCSNNRVIVTIVTDPVLDFQPNTYTLNCTDNNASQWTGVGQTGNILEVSPTVNKVGRMNW